MRLRFVLPLLAVVVGGCSSSTTSVAGSCVLAARIGDVTYGEQGEVSADRVGPEFTRTTRWRDCEDVIIAGEPRPEGWKSGDSSFPPNTPLYASLDHPTSEVLLATWGDGRYVQLRRLPHPGSPANP
jgi:hypothetical protein